MSIFDFCLVGIGIGAIVLLVRFLRKSDTPLSFAGIAPAIKGRFRPKGRHQGLRECARRRAQIAKGMLEATR